MSDSKQGFSDEMINSWNIYAKTFLWKLSIERGRLFAHPERFQAMIDDGTLSKDSGAVLQRLAKNSHKLDPKAASELSEEVTQLLRDALDEIVKPLLSKDDPWDKLSEKVKSEISDNHFSLSTGMNPGYFRVVLEELLINGVRS